MSPDIQSLNTTASRRTSPMRRLSVLLQVSPSLEVLATSNDESRLEAERDTLLAMPWDQDVNGTREMRIVSAIHLPRVSHDRRGFKRQNRFR